MQKRWHYLYVIIYPSLGYKFYYGSRITKTHPEADTEYFGSSVTFAHYNDEKSPDYQADAVKVILHATHRRHSRKSTETLNAAEADLIKAALHNTDYLGPNICLNRNVRGQIYMTEEERQIAHARSIAAGSGFTNMTPARHKRVAAAGGRKSAELKKGIHAIPEEVLQESRARGRKSIAEKYAKTYVFISPSGEYVTLKNLNAFCREHNLNPGHMRSVNSGRIKSCKGWRKP